MWQLIFCTSINIMTTTCSQGPFVEQKIFHDWWMVDSVVYIFRFHCHAINTAKKINQWKKPRNEMF